MSDEPSGGGDDEEAQNRSDIENAIGASADATAKAILDTPDLSPEDRSKIDSQVKDGSYTATTYKEGTPEKAYGDAIQKIAKDLIEKLSNTEDLTLDATAPPSDPLSLSDETTSAGKSNVAKIRTFIAKIFKNIGVKIDPETGEGLDTPSAKAAIEKAKTNLTEQIKTEPSSSKQKILEIIVKLLGLGDGLLIIWKINKLKQFLDDLAKSMAECDEVNYSKRTQTNLQCTQTDAVKTACACPGAPDSLKSLCTAVDPSHACGQGVDGYSYVYMEFGWYDALAAIAHGLTPHPLDWLTRNKWTIIIGVSVFLVFLLLFGLIKHYAFK